MSDSNDRPTGHLDQFVFLSRRRFLKLSLLGAGAVAAAGGGAAGGLWAMRGRAPAVDDLSVLTNHEYRTLTNIAAAHMPQGGAFPLGAADFDLVRLFDDFLKDEPAANISNLKSALLLFEYGPLIFDWRFTTFSNLSDDDRMAHWKAWHGSDSLVRRQAAFAFKNFLSMVFFDQPEVWPHIGYPGPALQVEGQQ